MKYLSLLCLLAVLAPVSVARTVQDKPQTGAFNPLEVLEIMERTSEGGDLREFRKVLADSFRFTPDLATVSAHPQVPWKKWDIGLEMNFLERLLSPARDAELVLSRGVRQRTTENRNRADYEIRYEIHFDGTTYSGEATFRFVETDSRWYLWQWLESVPVTTRESGSPLNTSGELRALLSR